MRTYVSTFPCCVWLLPHRSHAILTVHLTTTRTTSSGASENGANNTINRGLQTEEGTQGGGPTAAARGGRGEGYTTSKLNLVDLAGSEKSSVVSSAKAGDAAVLHREGRSINKSLAFLEQVLGPLVRLGSDRGGGRVSHSESTFPPGARPASSSSSRCLAPCARVLVFACALYTTFFTCVNARCAFIFHCRSRSRWPTERGSTSHSGVQNSPIS